MDYIISFYSAWQHSCLGYYDLDYYPIYGDISFMQQPSVSLREGQRDNAAMNHI